MNEEQDKSIMSWPLDHITQKSLERWLNNTTTIDNKITKVISLVDRATVITDAFIGNIFTLTPTQSFTMANPINPVNGKRIIYKIKQDSTGGRVVTWGSKFRASSVVVDTTGLVSYWKMDESSGNAADSHGSNTLVNNNTTAYATGKINNGADLETGSSNFFSIADASQSGLDFSSALTFSLWVRFETFTGTALIFKRTDGGGQESFRFQMNATSISLTTSSDGTTNDGSVSVDHTAVTTTWYHVVVTKDGTTVKFYVNGAEVSANLTGTVPATIFNGTGAFRVGSNEGISNFFDGIMDEISVWSRALSASEISLLYNLSSGLAYPLASARSLPTIATRAAYVDYIEFIYDSVADRWNLLSL